MGYKVAAQMSTALPDRATLRDACTRFARDAEINVRGRGISAYQVAAVMASANAAMDGKRAFGSLASARMMTRSSLGE